MPISHSEAQAELLGTDPDMRDLVARKAAAPLQAAKPQELCDIGLFGDTAAQTDLIDFLKEARPHARRY
jgi:hypothetical protein